MPPGVDHRGRPVRLLRSWQWRVPESQQGWYDKALVDARLGTFAARKQFSKYWLALSIGLGASVIAGSLLGRHGLPRANLYLLTSVAFSVACVWRILFGKGQDWLYKPVLYGHSAQCGFDLAGVEADSDGFSVCPECGASWRMPMNNADR
ncbi:MAG: hypothetical protein AAGK04_05900 [Planctomycetota bacterium]